MSDWYVLAADGKTPVIVPDITVDPVGYRAAMQNRKERYDWVVGKNDVGEYKVSTVFLFLDHQYDEGVPVLWESMVFGEGPWGNYCDRYTSREDAENGHKAIIERIAESAEADGLVSKLEGLAGNLREAMTNRSHSKEWGTYRECGHGETRYGIKMFGKVVAEITLRDEKDGR